MIHEVPRPHHHVCQGKKGRERKEKVMKGNGRDERRARQREASKEAKNMIEERNEREGKEGGERRGGKEKGKGGEGGGSTRHLGRRSNASAPRLRRECNEPPTEAYSLQLTNSGMYDMNNKSSFGSPKRTSQAVTPRQVLVQRISLNAQAAPRRSGKHNYNVGDGSVGILKCGRSPYRTVGWFHRRRSSRLLMLLAVSSFQTTHSSSFCMYFPAFGSAESWDGLRGLIGSAARLRFLPPSRFLSWGVGGFTVEAFQRGC